MWKYLAFPLLSIKLFICNSCNDNVSNSEPYFLWILILPVLTIVVSIILHDHAIPASSVLLKYFEMFF